jgi:hypothetical protein
MTLVDVVMAIALLGIMGGGVLGSFRYGFATLDSARNNQRATQILLEKVETLRLYSWDQITTPGFIPATLPTEYYDPQAAPGAKGTAYYGKITLGACPLTSSYAANMRLVTVTLSWTNRDISHTRVLSTFISKDGIQNYVY